MTAPTLPASDPAPGAASGEPRPQVVTAVMFVDQESLRVAVEAVKGQVYEVGSVTIIGGGEEVADAGVQLGVSHQADFMAWLAGLGSEAEFVWLVHGDARPRPDALGALVDEAIRNDASMIGSKVLDGTDPRMLESIGSSSDVFGELYSGLDPREVDLEQYDVVRDVASVSAVSVLIRRDLLRGLGGVDPQLGPPVAGQDLAQRARLAGGRVMVAPSSEVIHRGRCVGGRPSWREQAGRMRAMLKAYRLPTLAWVVPIGFLLGLVDGIGRLLLGRIRPLVDLFMATGWNILNLPSTITARRRLAPVRQAGDEELFRYQVGGSVRVRRLAADFGERFGWIVDDEPGVVSEDQMQHEGSLAGPVVAGLAILVIGLATRVVWLSASNAVGYWLPPHPEAGSVLAGYAGGWNPAGLGSPESLHPSAAVVALVQWVLGGWQGALPVVSFVSIFGGGLGVSRLLNRIGVTTSARHLAAIVYILGPFAGRFTAEAYWPGLMALGALPWLVDALVVRWPLGGRRRIGRLAQMVLSAGLVSVFLPVGTLAGVVAALLGVVILKPVTWIRAVGWSMVAAVVGADLIAPYLLGVAPNSITDSSIGVTIWPHPVALAMGAVAAVATVLFGSARASAVAGWGAAMVVVPLAVSRWAGTGELLMTSVALASLGLAIVVGAAFDIDLERTRISLVAQALGATAGAVLVLAAMVPVPDGRAGMPDDRWGEALTFADELVAGTTGERVLIMGSPDSMPGAYRVGNGYAYRLVGGATPTLDQAWLASPRIGDRALAETLNLVDASSDVRPGSTLAGFGVRWVVVTDGAPPIESLRSQVDLAARNFDPGIAVYENLAFRGRVTTEGPAWEAERVGATGPPGPGRVRLADNADPGWSPDWNQQEWANELSAAEGVVSFRADGLRRGLAVASLVLMLAAAAAAWWGREQRA